VSLASDDNGYVYALRRDGVVVQNRPRTTTWGSKGDAGDGNAWVAICAFNSSGQIYAMSANRTIVRCDIGTSTTWSDWASRGSDYSWVAIAVNDTHVLALRNDGRIDRATIKATPTWSTAFGDVGTDTAWTDLSLPIPEVTSVVLQAVITIALIFAIRRRFTGKDQDMNGREEEGS